MYTLYEDEQALSTESMIRLATSAADFAVDCDEAGDVDEAAGWARHAHAASGFGDAESTPDD